MHSLVMSIRCRLATEVVFALNSLTLISLAMRANPQEASAYTFPFALAQCGDLLEELIDLLEETALGEQDCTRDAEAPCEDAPDDHASPTPDTSPQSYRDLFRLVAREETDLLNPPESSIKPLAALADRASPALSPVELCLTITNLFRNFSISEENARFMSSMPHFIEVLVKVAELPLIRRGSRAEEEPSWPLRVSAADSLALKKDVLEILTHTGVEVLLDNHRPETAAALFDFLLFFLVQADDHDQLYFDLSTAPTMAARIPQTSDARVGPYLELGLAAFARITLPDSNRRIVARLTPKADLFSVFESLIHLLPVNEPEFQLITTEGGLVIIENLLMSIYNLAFLAPVELKTRLRNHPGFVRALLRVIRRLAGGTHDHDQNPFLILSDRCLATLQVLSDLTGVSASDQEVSEGLWWGLSMGGEEEYKPSSCQPTEADRGTVKQRMPPSSVDSKASGPPILAAEVRSLFESLSTGSLPGAFGRLAPMMDATRNTSERLLSG